MLGTKGPENLPRKNVPIMCGMLSRDSKVEKRSCPEILRREKCAENVGRETR